MIIIIIYHLQGSELSVKEKEMLRSGLRSLHSVGLRHGDVQVRNVVRDEDGNPMLAYCERALIVCHDLIYLFITKTNVAK